MKSQKDRADERRRQKLADIQDQVDQGTLKIREMTSEERAAHPPRPRKEKPRNR